MEIFVVLIPVVALPVVIMLSGSLAKTFTRGKYEENTYMIQDTLLYIFFYSNRYIMHLGKRNYALNYVKF